MVYLETGRMSWASVYGTGRYINELVKTNVYDFVICAVSQKDNVPIIKKDKIIALDDFEYRTQLSNFILNLKIGDVIHFPANTIIVTNIPEYVKVVYTIHDLTPLFFYKNKKRNGNYFSDGTPLSTNEWKKNILYASKRADCILAVSENTKKDIIKYCAVSEEKIVVVYHGIDMKFERYSSEVIEEKKGEYGLSNRKTIMGIIGGKHKNLTRVIIAFYLLCIENWRENYCLILVGAIMPKINILTKGLQSKGKVYFTGRISDEDLVMFYNISDCFVFVSLYEGFGFPLLEAYACGANVITSNTSSLKELSGEYARQIDPKNILQIINAMKENDLRTEVEIKEQISYAKSFTWQRFRETHREIIENLTKIK